MTAMTAATLDQLSDGRMMLGIGSSGPQVAEGWHGQRFGRQLQRTREYVAVVRKALARERVEFDGETLELPLPDGPGKALKLTIGPVQERIPILLAAIGPKNTALAGEVADGWIPTFFSPDHVSDFATAARGGRRKRRALARRLRDRARRSTSTSPTTARRRAISCVRCSRSTSAGWARATRTSTTRWSGATGTRRRRSEVQDLYLEGRKDEAAAALPDELIDLVSLCRAARRGPRAPARVTATPASGR